MSFFVTRLWIPVPSSCVMSTACSDAIFRTKGEERRRIRSSMDSTRPPSFTEASEGKPSAAAAAVGGGGGCGAAGAAGSGGWASAGLASGGFATAGSSGAGCAAGRGGGTGGAGFASAGCGAAGAAESAEALAEAEAEAAGCSPASPIEATTVLIATVCPSGTLISRSVPATGEGISASTLSVEISKIGSSRLTVSPTFFIHLVIVPSAMDSPICGMMTSVAIGLLFVSLTSF
jgi:hypothetical protein